MPRICHRVHPVLLAVAIVLGLVLNAARTEAGETFVATVAESGSCCIESDAVPASGDV